MQTKALPGFRDFYPDDLALRAHIFRTWRMVATRYGFEEYDGPPLEPLDLYTTKSGDEIVGQLYNFTDKGDRQVALRPEMTPTLARMVAARANGLKKPIRWFSIPQLFRYERQQRGRLREHFQLNCDLIGEAGPLADAEIIALAIDVMRAFGFTPADVKVRISDRSLLKTVLGAMGIKGEQLALAYQALDKMGRREFADIRQALEAAGVPAALIGELESLRSLDNLSDVSRRFPQARTQVESLERVFAALQAMGLSDFVALDLTIVRGLAYYTGTVFELFDASRSMRAICGGGRYDTLLQSLGGPELPALGFGMGDVVLADLLRDRELKPMEEPSIDVFLAGISNDDLPHVLALAHRLREAGVRVEYALSTQSLGKQLKLADARNARLVVVLGPDERARGELVIKDLRGQAQETVSEASAVDALKARLNG